MNPNDHVKHNCSLPLTFRPYYAQKYLAFLFCLASFALLFFLFLTFTLSIGKMILVVLAFTALALAFLMNSQSKLSVKFNAVGMELSNGRQSFHALWEEFAVVYCMFDSKGHTYMLFATSDMDLRCRREIIRQILSIDRHGIKLDANRNVFLRVDDYKASIFSIVGTKLPFVDVSDENHGI